ncbi:MAG: Glycine dehydrogenase (decarboxylating) [Sodalis sp.]|nr:MAG: Glycine dehydrogenase (decarboxylating) [Sodalis sp.]
MQMCEQHISREKANSNTHTSQVLLDNIAGLYAVYHGPGASATASRMHRLEHKDLELNQAMILLESCTMKP